MKLSARNVIKGSYAIYFDQRDYATAEDRYRRVLATVEPNSYDFFDALSHLGRIQYLRGEYDEAPGAPESSDSEILLGIRVGPRDRMAPSPFVCRDLYWKPVR